MPARPSLDLATEAAAVSGLTLGGTTETGGVFAGAVRPPLLTKIPQKAIFCTPVGGREATRVMGAANVDVQNPRLKVTVRGTPQDYDTTEVLARALQSGLDKRTSAALTTAGYLSLLTLQSEPLYAGQDNGERHIFTFDVEMRYAG